jgi:hypothetical protein
MTRTRTTRTTTTRTRTRTEEDDCVAGESTTGHSRILEKTEQYDTWFCALWEIGKLRGGEFIMWIRSGLRTKSLIHLHPSPFSHSHFSSALAISIRTHIFPCCFLVLETQNLEPSRTKKNGAKEEVDAKSRERRVGRQWGSPMLGEGGKHGQGAHGSPMCGREAREIKLMPRRGEDNPRKMHHNSGHEGHAGAMMMLAYKIFSLSRILSSAKTFP